MLEAVCRKKGKDDDDSGGGGEARITVDKLKSNIQQFASDIDAFTDNAGLIQVPK